MSELTIWDQIDCVRRELAKRRRIYPRLVAGQKMKQAEADREIATMEAVQITLRTVAASRDLVGITRG